MPFRAPKALLGLYMYILTPLLLNVNNVAAWTEAPPKVLGFDFIKQSNRQIPSANRLGKRQDTVTATLENLGIT